MIRGKIAKMLCGQKRQISFHTPGHKKRGADITELSYSDNLFSPHGVIKEAQEEIAERLGAYRTFFLTDGSTAGVHAMLFALKERGAKRVALSPYSHPSVTGGCKLLGLEPVLIPVSLKEGIPLQPAREEVEKTLQNADALLLTSPDYYGFFPDLAFARELTERENKPLVVDGAHGSHLHFSESYAGRYADMWVDGAHKSLPALTQGAAVSAKREEWAGALEEGVRLFHTSSPSYPILASVEEAFLYPRNLEIERAAEEFKREVGAIRNDDWTKVLIRYGRNAGAVEKFLESRGVYPEFNDGNYILFYLSPCTKKGELKQLSKLLKKCPAPEAGEEEAHTAEVMNEQDGAFEYIPLKEAVGRICAADAGIFPPSLPIIRKGERINESAVRHLENAVHTFGLKEGKIAVYTEKE
ncbi:MAG: aminotransferase class I/II-fold pyridoxal phosphate-dependent enzyme [Clostridia bacterium]|nr:aminotransferase class I/II-fold pyridoxal phosphate-dependent enzyme [Clostridia bacterium]